MDMKVYSKGYNIMIAACVISDEIDGMDYEEIWELAKLIQKSWKAGIGSGYHYIQDYAKAVCERFKDIYANIES